MGREYPAPIVRKAKGCWPDLDDLLADESKGHAFGTAHTYAYTRQHSFASVATKITESLLGVPMSIPLYNCHTPYDATRLRVRLLSRGASTIGTAPLKDL